MEFHEILLINSLGTHATKLLSHTGRQKFSETVQSSSGHPKTYKSIKIISQIILVSFPSILSGMQVYSGMNHLLVEIR